MTHNVPEPIALECWDKSIASVRADLDGDVVLRDEKGYRIVLSQVGAAMLRKWLDDYCRYVSGHKSVGKTFAPP